ncbi:hypothetical protein ACLEPN_22040 [Myxococcus sp. 1LA]
MDDQQTSKGGRPVNPSGTRKVRTYREKLDAAGVDLLAIREANRWARQHGVTLDPRAELLERSAGPAINVPFRRVPEPEAARRPGQRGRAGGTTRRPGQRGRAPPGRR